MTSTTRETVRLAIDAATRAKLGRTTGGRPAAYRRKEEQQPQAAEPGSWMRVASRPRHSLSPFYCLAVYEGEEC